jgi:hypothetical protein
MRAAPLRTAIEHNSGAKGPLALHASRCPQSCPDRMSENHWSHAARHHTFIFNRRRAHTLLWISAQQNCGMLLLQLPHKMPTPRKTS